jgi:nucleoside-diphosphate-sugar epimerase
MDILLTGASGFLGRNFIASAPDSWRILAVYYNDKRFPEFLSATNKPNVICVQCDLNDPERVTSLVAKHGREWECCLYLAGKVDIPWSTREPKQDLFLNVGSLLNLLERTRFDKFVYFSSGAVYDRLQGETSPDARVAPLLPYAIAKLAAERYVSFYNQDRRTVAKALIVRFFGAYGPFEAPHKIYTRLIQAFAIEKKDFYTIYGNGQNLIDAMYVDDAVRAIHQILRGTHWNDTINLAAGSPVTIETLVRDVARLLDVDSVCIEKQGIAHESIHFWGSTREMTDYFGFRPAIALSEGILRLRDFLMDPSRAGREPAGPQ